jgi:molecular chaperone GrpE
LAEEDQVLSGKEASELAEDMDIETLKTALAEEKEKAETYLGNWQRAEADFSNYKKRAEQERNEVGNSANVALILNLLPVLDDLDRALASLLPESADRTWVEGVTLIHRKLRGVLEAQGLTEIEAVGEPFDPSLHEAVAHHEGEEGVVIGEVQRGYKLNDKVLRPTLAVVGKGDEEKAGEGESEGVAEI